VAEALALCAVAGPLAERLRGLVRVGERRWDAVIEDGPKIMLPAHGAVAALERAAALEAAEDLTGRDVTHLDLRDPGRPVVRLGQAAKLEMARALEAERSGGPAEEPGDAE
jgi:cell division protein FtsQ